jgi:uncharacterized C2H2 Zn-finger protein
MECAELTATVLLLQNQVKALQERLMVEDAAKKDLARTSTALRERVTALEDNFKVLRSSLHMEALAVSGDAVGAKRRRYGDVDDVGSAESTGMDLGPLPTFGTSGIPAAASAAPASTAAVGVAAKRGRGRPRGGGRGAAAAAAAPPLIHNDMASAAAAVAAGMLANAVAASTGSATVADAAAAAAGRGSGMSSGGALSALLQHAVLPAGAGAVGVGAEGGGGDGSMGDGGSAAQSDLLLQTLSQAAGGSAAALEAATRLGLGDPSLAQTLARAAGAARSVAAAASASNAAGAGAGAASGDASGPLSPSTGAAANGAGAGVRNGGGGGAAGSDAGSGVHSSNGSGSGRGGAPPSDLTMYGPPAAAHLLLPMRAAERPQCVHCPLLIFANWAQAQEHQATAHAMVSAGLQAEPTTDASGQQRPALRPRMTHRDCPDCGRDIAPGQMFAPQSTFMLAHRAEHNTVSEKPFVCEVQVPGKGACGAQCHTRGVFIKHVRVHLGEKPFQCPHCACAFTNNSHCQRHINTKHTHTHVWVCSGCGRDFLRRDKQLCHERKCPHVASAAAGGSMGLGLGSGGAGGLNGVDIAGNLAAAASSGSMLALMGDAAAGEAGAGGVGGGAGMVHSSLASAAEELATALGHHASGRLPAGLGLAVTGSEHDGGGSSAPSSASSANGHGAGDAGGSSVAGGGASHTFSLPPAPGFAAFMSGDPMGFVTGVHIGAGMAGDPGSAAGESASGHDAVGAGPEVQQLQHQPQQPLGGAGEGSAAAGSAVEAANEHARLSSSAAAAAAAAAHEGLSLAHHTHHLHPNSMYGDSAL